MHLPDSIDNLASLTDPADCRLGENEVHVWYCRYDPSADAPLGARYDALMTAEERARGERFRFERDRLQMEELREQAKPNTQDVRTGSFMLNRASEWEMKGAAVGAAAGSQNEATE